MILSPFKPYTHKQLIAAGYTFDKDTGFYRNKDENFTDCRTADGRLSSMSLRHVISAAAITKAIEAEQQAVKPQ